MTYRFNSSCLLFVGLAFVTWASRAQISLTDDLNRAITLTAPAQRVVSLAPSITETLFAIGAGDQIVGVTDYCNYPEPTRAKKRVGGITNPSIEAVVGLNPDLLIVSMEGNVREDFVKLTGLGVPVFVSNPRTLRGIYKSINDLGLLTGRTAEARRLEQSMQSRETAITASTEMRIQRKVMLVVSLQPLIVVGSGTFLSELLDLASAENIARGSASSYPTYSRETVLAQDPDVIIIMSGLMPDPGELIRLFPEWQRLSAIKHENVFDIDADIVSRPGPRAIDALETLYTIVHRKAK